MTPNVIRANGVHFAYLDAGQGPLVLCLHGFPDTAWSFVPLLERLAAAGYRAVAPFMRGYPPSGPAPDGDYRVITLGRDALALIEVLGAQRAVLVGHDWGAAATYIAAALAPERVRTNGHRRRAPSAPFPARAKSSPAQTFAIHGVLPVARHPGEARRRG